MELKCPDCVGVLCVADVQDFKYVHLFWNGYPVYLYES